MPKHSWKHGPHYEHIAVDDRPPLIVFTGVRDDDISFNAQARVYEGRAREDYEKVKASVRERLDTFLNEDEGELY